MKISVYNATAERVREIDLPPSMATAKGSPDLIHQVAVSLQGNRRKGLAKAKDREEVSGGGRKPWRQKGTGRARHGSIRSPLWAGGGVTHGPTGERIYTRKINRKMAKVAKLLVLKKKAEEGELILVDALTLETMKTKAAGALIQSFEKGDVLKKGATLLILTSDVKSEISRAFRNLKKVSVRPARDINVLDLLSHKFVLAEEKIIHGTL